MAEWKRVRLGELFEFLSGKAKPKESGAYPIYGSNGIIGYAPDYMYEDAFVIGRVGAIGELAYCKEKFWASDNTIVARLMRGVADADFSRYILENANLKSEVHGSVQPLITKGGLRVIEVSLPPLATQKKIAAVLGAIDDKIETNRKICANLEAQAQALFKSWFVDFEPFGGKMPKDWKVGTLGNVFVFKRGTAISKKDVSEVRDIENKFVVYGAGRDVFGYSSKATIHEPSVLITAIGAGSGDVSRTHELSYSVTSNAFYVTPKVPSDFPYAYLRLKNFDFHLHCSGSAQPMLAYGAFENESIEAPTNKIINEFCKVVGPLLEMYDCSLAGINRLASMRDALLPRLMSGEIDVEKVEVA